MRCYIVSIGSQRIDCRRPIVFEDLVLCHFDAAFWPLYAAPIVEDALIGLCGNAAGKPSTDIAATGVIKRLNGGGAGAAATEQAADRAARVGLSRRLCVKSARSLLPAKSLSLTGATVTAKSPPPRSRVSRFLPLG